MKRTIILITALCALILPVCSRAQGSSISQDDTNKSLDIARNILKAAAGISDDFVQFKGDFLQKDNSGNSYYMVKGIEIGTSSQYIIVRPDGVISYAAVFDPKDANDKTPILAFTAFTGGIITIRQNSDITVEQDAAQSTGSTLKYYLKAKDIKIASFTFDTGTKSGTLLIAIQ